MAAVLWRWTILSTDVVYPDVGGGTQTAAVLVLFERTAFRKTIQAHRHLLKVHTRTLCGTVGRVLMVSVVPVCRRRRSHNFLRVLHILSRLK